MAQNANRMPNYRDEDITFLMGLYLDRAREGRAESTESALPQGQGYRTL